MQDDYDDFDDHSDSYQALNHFIADLKGDPQAHSQGDAYYFDRLRWVAGQTPDEIDRLDLYGSILPLIAKKSLMHRFMAEDTLTMALEHMENNLDPQSTLSAILVATSYYTPDTDEHAACYRLTQDMVRNNNLHDEEHAIALHFLIGQPSSTKQTAYYQKLWDSHVSAIQYPDEQYHILSHALAYDATYPVSFLHILSGQLRDSIAKHEWSPEVSHELIEGMINKSDDDQLLQAFWCRIFHANNFISSWNMHGDPSYDALAQDITPHQTHSSDTWREELAGLYQGLEEFSAYASLAKEYSPTNTSFLKKRVRKILSFEDQNDRLAALITHARQAVACYQESDDIGELINAQIIDRVISQWPHPVEDGSGDLQSMIAERQFITSLFTHPDTQSPAVLHFMQNKFTHYKMIDTHAHDDITPSKRDEFSINTTSFLSLPEFISNDTRSALAIEN